MADSHTIEFVGNVLVVRHPSGYTDVYTVEQLQQEKNNIDNQVILLEAESLTIGNQIAKMTKPPNIARRMYNEVRKRFLVHRMVT